MRNIAARLMILPVVFITAMLCGCVSPAIVDSLVKVQADNAVVNGIIVDQAGYVATGSNALGNSTAASVEIKPGQSYEGRLICRDSERALALLKIEAPELKAALLGDSDLVRQWDEVAVWGFKPGEGVASESKGSVTSLPKDEQITYLQTNAALDASQAGSAVLNKAGEMVGMVSWNADQPGREGFVLTSNEIQRVLDQAREAESDPLAVASIDSPSVFSDRAVISWQTNRPATGQVEFGLRESYGNKTALDATMLNTHAIMLQGLVPKTVYYFRVLSVDCCGNAVASKGYTLTTTAAGAQAGEFTISNVDVYDITSTAASVRWITSKPATGTVNYTADKETESDSETDNSFVYEHKFRLNGLYPQTRYNVTVKSETDFDETAQQALNPFTTPPTSPVCCKMNCRILDFSFKTLQGDDFTNSDIAGKKVFIIFTKTSCPTCMKQALFLNDVYRNWPKGSDMLMFMVASSEKQADVEEWIKKYGLVMPVYIDPTAKLVSGCQFRTIPTALFLDTGSVIRDYKSGGFGSQKEMETVIKNFYEQER
ncbi:MAG: trypsin-like peptidase domain-containing protein [Dehalococcoidia bacterium]